MKSFYNLWYLNGVCVDAGARITNVTCLDLEKTEYAIQQEVLDFSCLEEIKFT